MGYEVTIYACERMDAFKDGCHIVVASVELCKPGQGAFSTLMGNAGNSRVTDAPLAYFYGTDGNTHIAEDSYGDPLAVMSVDDVIKALTADNKREKYRRFDLALATLKAFKKGFPDGVILGYGH